MYKAALFGLWGGVLTPHPLKSFQEVEKVINLSKDFIWNTVVKGGDQNALFRAERGKLTLTQMFPELEAECQKEADSQGLPLPAQFSAQTLFDEVRRVEFNKTVLDAAATLQRQGISTCVLANIWVDDTPQRDNTAKVLSVLESHFDLVVRSCHVGAKFPEPAVFHSALDKLNVKPHEALWLDVSEESVKAAESLGMTAVHITDISEALKKMEKLTGIKLTGEQMPRFCGPEEVSHGYVTVKPGVKIHYVEMGDGPPVLLCHGFPESWFSWKYQIPALADAGFRVIAADMKGYGDSSAPADIEEYSQESLSQDLVTFMDKLGLAQVTLVGHDWGGSLVWNMAQVHPERLRAVASLNTPLFPADPNKNPMDRLKSIPIFEYQLYFQEPGVAEAELEKNLARTFKLLFTASDDKSWVVSPGVLKKGGLFVGLPEEVPRSSILTEEALQYYVQQFTKSGFRGPLNWYRNIERNWRWLCSRPRSKILMPALMVTTGKDKVLLPSFSTGMEQTIPNLTRAHIEDCGHWTQMERPAELNKILISWLKETHQKASIPIFPKL
ncbi:bifunctional epoxide hydrolase 2 [Colossoma macropomum]|uniref:bifunctional epoxide hydrolase 2 n=1 Tax=Colossoma macropomum TaxID=42526 RepID=UPI00186481AE|nr:bifunctional epoxide hydrolase 2 [Colossoma macropomum]